MSLAVGRARLLWPSNTDEAVKELDRVGGAGPWPGLLGTPPRDGRADPDADAAVALRWPEPIPDEIWAADPPARLQRAGSKGGRGLILFGPASKLLGWLEEMGGEAEEARKAVSFGACMETPGHWQAGWISVPLNDRTRVTAVINVAPDSFYKGSRAGDPAEVEEALERAVEGGADMLDIGGESSRPGAEPLPVEVELERVMPAVELAMARTQLAVSVDTTKAEVARAALEAGAVVVNDISAGTADPGMLPLVAEKGAGLVMMHRMGSSATMQDDPQYEDLMGEIYDYLACRVDAALEAGVKPDRVVIDPGLGFGKRRQHNFELYRRVSEFHSMGYPLMIGPSRKRHTSGPADRPAEERLMATAAACAILAYQGVQILRVHDVGEMRRALDTVDEIRGAVVEDRVS